MQKVYVLLKKKVKKQTNNYSSHLFILVKKYFNVFSVARPKLYFVKFTKWISPG